MSSFQLKNYETCKKQGTIVHSQKKLIEIVPEEAQTLDLSGKDFKSTVLINQSTKGNQEYHI